MARDREKNIWPPAVPRMVIRFGDSSIKPPLIAYPGTNMNFSPSMALGSVRERTMTISSITAKAGMPILLNFSIPPETPPMTISMQITINSSVKMKHPNGLVSMAPNVAAPEIGAPKISLSLKLSSARLRDMYCSTYPPRTE